MAVYYAGNGSLRMTKGVAQRRMFFMLSTVAAPLSLSSTKIRTIKISKNGGVPAAASGAVTRLASGWAYITFTANDLNTSGNLMVESLSSLGTSRAVWVDHVIPASGPGQITASEVWSYTTRILTSGAVVADSVWVETVRTLTSAAVTWTAGTRTLTSAGVTWSAGTRTLTSGANVWAAAITEVTGVPAAAPTAKAAMGFMYVTTRNKRVTTATGDKVYNSASAVIAKATLTATQTSFTKAKYVTATA